MSKQGPPEGYIEVSDRIRAFMAAHPEGSLTGDVERIVSLPTETEAGKVTRTFIVYRAYANRAPDDPKPGVGTAWEPFPGLTPFTRNSELMNAETSAWGRALAAVGFVGKSVATTEEIQARDTPPALNDEKAQELRKEIRELFMQIQLLSTTAMPPGRFDLMLSQREHEHERLEEFREHLRSMLEHLQTKADEEKAEAKA